LGMPGERTGSVRRARVAAMGERTRHAPGTFSWADLTTTDGAGAKAFYTALFGWEAEDIPLPGGGVYVMLRKDGRDAAALSEPPEEQPPGWQLYVTVADVDAAAAAVAEHGGVVAAGPFDVMDAGRMAVAQDPAGAYLSLWQPAARIGAEVVNEPGALTLSQLNTTDPERARAFYEAVFGWRFEAMAEEGGEAPYWGIFLGDRVNGGMMPLPPGGDAPPHWLVYFGSESVDADAGRIEQLGGQVLLAPMDVPDGRILFATDPQGATFALYSGSFDF
jgi:uncharacterized protein